MNDYRLRSKNIIKWYEYNMMTLDEINKQKESSEDVPDTLDEQILSPQEVNDTLNEMIDEEEEIDLATTGLNDDEQALVADIMMRFKEAKQSTVDDLFSGSEGDEALGDTGSDNVQMSEEELIAAICAPKQNNVDAFVNIAQNE